jgi:hypothetical protein
MSGILGSDWKELVEASKEIGKAIAESRMFGAQNVGQGVVIALHCFQTGTPVLNFQREFHLIDGKPSKKAESMLADFNKLGGKHRWIKDGRDGESAEIELVLGGSTVIGIYTTKEAAAAGLIKPNSAWVTSRPNLLRARAVSNGIRMIAPEVVVGCYTPEEIEDIPVHESAAGSEYAQPIVSNKPAKKTKPQPEQPSGELVAPVAAAVESPVVTQPAAAEQVATQPAAEPVVTQPAAVQPVAATVTTVESEPVTTLDHVTVLTQISEMLPEFKLEKTTPAWQQALQHFGVPLNPATNLHELKLGTPAQAQAVLQWLHAQRKKREAAKAGKSLDAWANQAVTPGAAAAKA